MASKYRNVFSSGLSAFDSSLPLPLPFDFPFPFPVVEEVGARTEDSEAEGAHTEDSEAEVGVDGDPDFNSSFDLGSSK
jgi:hypothetical protein